VVAQRREQGRPREAGVIGDPTRRKEDDRLVTGRGRWADAHPPGDALHLAFVRSPLAHAEVVGIDVSAAAARPGVVAAWSGAELSLPTGSPRLGGRGRPAAPLLAAERVRYPGEAVAVVVARTRAQAVDALEAVDVDYEPLPVVGDADAAATGERLVHDDQPGNIAGDTSRSEGDVEAALAGSDVVVRRRFSLARVAPTAMEPRSVTVVPDGDGYLVRMSTQTPHISRWMLARAAGLPEESVHVVAADVGGGFGGKIGVYAEETVALLAAMRLGRPVTWSATRSEDLATTVHGRVLVQDVAIGAMRDGRLTALDVTLLSDIGAYVGPVGAGSALYADSMYPGIYRFDAFRISGQAVYTNRTPVGAYRGAGRPEATYAIERAMDDLAAELGVDPMELRRRSWATEFPFTTLGGETYDVGDYAAAADRALELFGYDDLRAEQARRREAADPVQLGVGISTYVEVCGGGIVYSKQSAETASVRLTPTGGAEVLAPTSAYGQGHVTSWSQIVAHRLGIPVEDVTVLQGDTTRVAHGYDSYGSRSLVIGGTAVAAAADRVVERAREVASRLLEADPGDLDFADGRFSVRGVPGAEKTMAEVALASYRAPEAVGDAEPGLPCVERTDNDIVTYPAGTHLAAVEVDTETGFVRVRSYVAVDDVGTVVNPMLVEGQVHGGVVQAIGQALYEEVSYDEDGNLVTGTLVDYTVPSAADVPALTTDRTVTVTAANPLGAKGAGEAGAIGGTPAIANAVLDALRPYGVTDIPLPMTPERVWRALRGRPASS
jgi:carbon-monoxide dehydrogenase large subunit